MHVFKQIIWAIVGIAVIIGGVMAIQYAFRDKSVPIRGKVTEIYIADAGERKPNDKTTWSRVEIVGVEDGKTHILYTKPEDAVSKEVPGKVKKDETYTFKVLFDDSVNLEYVLGLDYDN